MILAACHAEPNDEEQSGRQSDTPLKSTQWLSLLSQESSEFPASGDIDFPKDLNSHPDARAESFVLEAIVRTTDAQHLGVQMQIDRIALTSSTASRSNPSSWAFTDVMRATVTLSKQGSQSLEHSESISRLALGLAGSEPDSLYVGNTRLKISQKDVCKAQYSFSGTANDGSLVSLNWQLTECPVKQSIGSFNQWSSTALDVAGQITQSGTSRALAGRGWILQRFGNLPSPGGAVIIDQARLVLDEQLLLDASRSRRRSGRGPKTVSSTLGALAKVRASTSGPRDITLQWMDVDDSLSAVSGARYPEQIKLESAGQGLSLLLTPLVDMPEIVDRMGARWSGAVIVSGSHEGYGFVNMDPLGASR